MHKHLYCISVFCFNSGLWAKDKTFCTDEHLSITKEGFEVQP